MLIGKFLLKWGWGILRKSLWHRFWDTLYVLQCPGNIWCVYSATLLWHDVFYHYECIIFYQVLNTGVTPWIYIYIIYIIYIYMNNNQHDALFIFSLLSYHTSTCFGRISSPSSGGRMYICGKWYLLYFCVDCHRPLVIIRTIQDARST
jgi:hypothetical protein